MSPLLSSEKLLELKEFILAGPAAVVKKPKVIEGEVEIIPEVVPEIRAFQSEVRLSFFFSFFFFLKVVETRERFSDCHSIEN